MFARLAEHSQNKLLAVQGFTLYIISRDPRINLRGKKMSYPFTHESKGRVAYSSEEDENKEHTQNFQWSSLQVLELAVVMEGVLGCDQQPRVLPKVTKLATSV